MGFKIAMRYNRSVFKIYISEKAKTINFYSGFFIKAGIAIESAKYLRLAYDDASNDIAFEILPNIGVKNECMKLFSTASGVVIFCSINPILASCMIDPKDIAGIYKEKSVIGPIKIDGFSKNGFILNVNNREQKILDKK